MVKYVKIDDSELGNKLRFLLYIRNKKPDWKLITAKNRKLLGETVPDVNLSDFDFFMACYPKPVFEEYVVLDENEQIIGNGAFDINYDKTADLVVTIDKEHRKKGYGTNLIRFMEEDLFKREDVSGITVMDYSQKEQTKKIMKKLGYEQTSTSCYIKRNPNFKITSKNCRELKRK